MGNNEAWVDVFGSRRTYDDNPRGNIDFDQLIVLTLLIMMMEYVQSANPSARFGMGRLRLRISDRRGFSRSRTKRTSASTDDDAERSSLLKTCRSLR